jgi:hypothetical protein
MRFGTSQVQRNFSDRKDLAVFTHCGSINGGAIIDHETPRERRLVAVGK